MTTCPGSSPHELHAVHGFVPPYLLERITRAAAGEQARHAARALELDTEHRARRESTAMPLVRGTLPEAAAGGRPQRTIADCHGSTSLPGDVVRAEGGPATGDPAADEAYDGLGATWSLYFDVYGRDSLDGRGLPLDASVHYGEQYDNAFWDGTRMVFGDGDGVTFTRFTAAVDVMGHELTHGVTQLTAGLAYRDQSGALNESISDVFGSLVKQRLLGQDAASADWLIGAGLFTDQVKGVALRSMKAPGTAYDDPTLGHDPQPATMSGYVTTTSDNGGVHINSGIPNHAFYLAATAIGGNAWEAAGQIWYDVLTGGTLAPDVDFAGFAAATVAAAGARFGEGSSQQAAVRDAWAQVEVGVTAGGGGGSPAPPPAGEVVRVERSGGIAGRQVARDVDLTELADADARSWQQLLRSGRLQRIEVGPPQPDRFVYRVCCPPRDVDVTAAEHELPDDVRALLERTLREG
ncbi:MAG: protealysin inhibitor emfourin [Angustibacter sp.]